MKTEKVTFLIRYRNTTVKYFAQVDTLAQVLRSNKHLLILDILIFADSQNKFIHISKKDIQNMLSWETEIIEELKNVNYLKR